ncbi:hypothetical protein AVEN_174358-1 [Araneus ventricosus]|uniref:Uncharacterized protein n=1 Tax=Araneus ventricosus TaxID=182803 RepID=A0A4Y2U8Y1_ARAVE|nr:hypothetical protein AVEN_174358-1 [Araneus ventricosus]
MNLIRFIILYVILAILSAEDMAEIRRVSRDASMDDDASSTDSWTDSSTDDEMNSSKDDEMNASSILAKTLKSADVFVTSSDKFPDFMCFN